MGRTERISARRVISGVAGLLATLVLAGGLPGIASAASFDPTVGFDVTTLPGVDLVINPVDDPLLDANDVLGMGTGAVEFEGSTDVCILIGASTDCTDTVAVTQPAPVSFLVTVTITAINSPMIGDEFTLVLRDLSLGAGYDRSFVTVDGDYNAIPGLDPTGVPAFAFDETNGINGFDPFIVIQDNVAQDDIRYYLGWTVSVGDSVTFRYDLEQGEILGSTPSMVWSAIPVIPEPGTALLFGLGLAGLAASGRRNR